MWQKTDDDIFLRSNTITIVTDEVNQRRKPCVECIAYLHGNKVNAAELGYLPIDMNFHL